MTMDVKQAVALDALVRKSDVPFLVNHLHLFSPAYLRLRELFHAARPPKCRIFSRGGNVGPRRDFSALWDYAPHDLSMIMGLGLGNPTFVSGLHAPDSEDGSTCHDVNVGFGGHEANVQVWNGKLPKTRWFEVWSHRMRMVYDDTAASKLMVNGRAVEVPDEKPLTNAVRAFAEAVRTGNPDWRFGAETSVVIARILHTAETGTVHA